MPGIGAYRDDAHEFEFDDRIEDPPPEMCASDPLPPRAPQQIPGAPLLNVFVVPPPPRTPRQPGPYVLCAARGGNEFGTFVALGHARRFRSGAEDAVELTLARRYVRDDDSRLRWPLRDILRGVQAPIRVSPCSLLPCRLQGDVIAEPPEDRGGAPAGKGEPHANRVCRAAAAPADDN